MKYYLKAVLLILFGLALIITIPVTSAQILDRVNTHPSEENKNHLNHFKLVISSPLNIDTSVHYQTRDRTAKAGEDYIATSGIAIIPAGKKEVLIAITILADKRAEADESFDLVISQPTGAIFPNTVTEIVATHTIVDDDSNLIATNNPLRRISDQDHFEKTLKQFMLQTYGKITPILYYTTGIGFPTAEVATTAASDGSSSTNTQVNGVDEADRLKNDSSYLYVASSQNTTIKTFSTLTANGDARLVDEILLNTNIAQQISGIYLHDEQLIALSGINNGYFWNEWFNPYYWRNHTTYLDFLTTEQGKLRKNNQMQVDGQLISSRRIGSTLYLITRHTPSLKGLIIYPSNEAEVDNNQALIEAATLKELLPDYSVHQNDLITQEGDLFNASDCFITEYSNTDHQEINIINVLSIDLNDTTAKPKGMCFIGNAEAIYVSISALYLATTKYNYQSENNIAIYNPDISTDIHKFSLDQSIISYKGSTEVNGHLGWQQDLKSFRMGEFKAKSAHPINQAPDSENVLGIITYTGNQISTTASPATLYTLQEDTTQKNRLKLLAQLPNNTRPSALGKVGEQIYATRFIGNKAYLVTFRSTDPLYIVNLDNPADPFIAGELQIDGYSDYLHPIGENFLLGIGKDAIATNDIGEIRGAWYQGVKLSLIDISNPQFPIEQWTEIIGKRGTNTAVSVSHHAFTSLQTGNNLKIVLPISLHENNTSTETEFPNTYHAWKYDALYSYNIDTVTGELSQQEILKANSDKEFYSQWQNDRSAILGGKLYYLHNNEVVSQGLR